MITFTYAIDQFKFCIADKEQVIKEFSRDQRLIFIKGTRLKKIYEEMGIIVNEENFLQDDDLLQLWTKLFTGVDEAQLPYWQVFANKLLHQGGLLYAFESILREKLSSPDNNTIYIPKSEGTKKEVHISFDGQGLTIEERCVFTAIKDSEENDLIAKKGSFLIKAYLLHHVALIDVNGKPTFQHVILQPEFKCKNSALRECLNQSPLPIMDFIKNLILKLFRLTPEPYKALFFQKTYYRNTIQLNNDSNSLIEGTRYAKITN